MITASSFASSTRINIGQAMRFRWHSFIDHRTHAVVKTDDKGNSVVRTETATVGLDDGVVRGETVDLAPWTKAVTTVEGRTATATSAVTVLKSELHARDDVNPILVPQLRMSTIEASADLFPLDKLRSDLMRLVLSADVVPSRVEEKRHLTRILDAFVEGLGARAQEALSHYLDRAASRLIRLIETEQREAAPPSVVHARA